MCYKEHFICPDRYKEGRLAPFIKRIERKKIKRDIKWRSLFAKNFILHLVEGLGFSELKTFNLALEAKRKMVLAI